MDSVKLNALPYFMEAFQTSVRRYPQQPMLVDAQHPEGLTRADVDEQSGRVYAFLKQRGIGREDMVMICLPRGAEIVAAMIGVWKAGAACTVAEDDLPTERLAFIRTDCGSKLVIDGAAWQEIMRTPPLDGYERADDHDAAFAIYTSGSTGEPKGVLQEYGCFRMYALNGPRFTTEPEKAYTETHIPPLYNVMGVANAAKYMLSLDCLHILPYEIAKDPHRLNRYFAEHSVSHTYMPTSVLRVIGEDLSPSVRFVAIGGEGANGLYMDGITLENTYSMSEAGYPLCKFVIDRPYALCPAGKPASDLIELHLLDPEGREVKQGQVGEICFETPFFRGYIKRPEETKEAFRGGLFHSGDLGKWDENGNLLVTGRVGDMLKINGNRVEPAEIEAAFLKVTGQSWCAAKGFSVGTRTQICLYYRDEEGLDVRRVREKMRAYLPDYMLPAVFRRVETVPLLPSGKTDKAALPEPDFNENRPAYAPPVTEAEQTLCRAFETAFELAPIGLDDDFFDLGGDSLLAMAVLAEAELPDINVLDIFEGKTPRVIAQMLAQRQAENAIEDYALAEARERERAHSMPPDLIAWFSHEHPGDFHMPGLTRFDPSVDAQRLCDALNRAAANRSALSVVIEKDDTGGLSLRYDAAVTPHYEVQRMTQAEFDALRPELLTTFEMFGAPLIHAGVYETENNVYLFLDIHHMIMDSSAMKLFYDDMGAAYRGESLGQDTYCAYLARRERETATTRYRMAKESLLQLFNDESWRVGITPDIHDGQQTRAYIPCRRVLTSAEFDALTERLGTSQNLLCIGFTLLALAKLEGTGKYLCLTIFHNRSDDLSRNAFGCLIGQLLVAAEIRPESSVAGFFRSVKASWVNGAANFSAGIEAMVASPRGHQVMQVSFYPSEITGGGFLASLGGTPEQMDRFVGGNIVELSVLISERPGVVVPVLGANPVHFSQEKQAAILDTLGTMIDRLLAVEHPETTTVGELLG